MKLKVNKHEKLDDASLKEVMLLLEQEEPISKKDACTKLNITYNTTRLARLITEYKERIERTYQIRKSLRNKPLDTAEKKDIIEQYLADIALLDISKSTYRSLNVIKALLREYGLPVRGRTASDYFINVPLLSDKAVKEHYVKGDLVFAARYGCAAEVSKFYGNTEKDGNIYRIYLLGKEQQYAYQPYYELADLTLAQKELHISVNGVTGIQGRPLQIK